MSANDYPSKEYLRSRFRYDEATGSLYWLPVTEESYGRGWKRFNTMYAGKEAGCLEKNGYRVVKLDQKWLQAHRICWIMLNGEIHTKAVVDHRNGQRSDNRAANLRVATQGLNLANTRARRDGLKGAYPHKGRWLSFAGRRTEDHKSYLGSFATEQEAHEAYKKAAVELFGDFARFE